MQAGRHTPTCTYGAAYLPSAMVHTCGRAADADTSPPPWGLVPAVPYTAPPSLPTPFQGHALQMLEDVNTGISWVTRKIDRYGGDPDNIVLVGQSAGGQLAALAMIRQVRVAGGVGWGGN